MKLFRSENEVLQDDKEKQETEKKTHTNDT